MKSFFYLLVLSFVNLNIAYIITVDSHAEECFFDNAPAGTKLGKFSAPFFLFINNIA